MSQPQDIESVRVLAERLAREHVAAGGKVVGYVTPCVPAELIEAAGMRPMMLAGGRETSTERGDRVMEDLFDSNLRAVFERLLKGEFDYLSAIVLPRANDSAHRMYYYLSELKRLGEAKLPPVLLCDVVMTPDEASRRYSVDALGRLWDQLREIGDGRAGDPELRAAIALGNGRVAGLQIVTETRTGKSERVMPATTALGMFAAARMLPEQFLEIAEGEVASWSGVRRADGPRIIVCGSAHDDARLHGVIEAAGGIVVGDYHASGELLIGEKVDLSAPPLEALADRHRGDLAASRRVAAAGPHIAAFAKAREADAAIFSYFPEEEALTWDYPEQKSALEANGVRVLRLSDQVRPFDVTNDFGNINQFVRGAGA